VSVLTRVLLFAVKEASRPLLANVGRHIGNACGNVLGRKIDEKHGTYPDEDEGIEECLEDEDEDEDEEPKK
jgi:hypothetical protein